MKIGICIVWFNPNKDDVLKKLNLIEKLNFPIVILDNSPIPLLDPKSIISNTITIKCFNKNIGIAAAQNEGIQFLKKLCVESILFLDQDSYFPNNKITDLINSYFKTKKNDDKFGGIGPSAINDYTKKTYEPRFTARKMIDIDLAIVPDLISSGSIIPISVFDDVGCFESELFIDGVDHEWCWRCVAKGYNFYLNTEIFLNHKLGEGDLVFFGFSFAIPKPIRTYYQYRNFIRLFPRSYVPKRWKLINLFKYLLKIPVYFIVSKDRFSFLKYSFKGIFDGFTNKSNSNI